jgi:hypothetical protein
MSVGKHQDKSEYRKLAHRKKKVGLDESLQKDAIQQGNQVPMERIKREWDDAMIKILIDLKK